MRGLKEHFEKLRLMEMKIFRQTFTAEAPEGAKESGTAQTNNERICTLYRYTENENAFLTIWDTETFYLHRNSRITASQLLIVHKTTDRAEQ